MNTQKDKIRAAAQKFLQKGQLDRAIREFQRLVEDDPSDVRTLLKIGDLQVRLNNTPAAVASYTSVAQFYAGQGFALKAIAVYKQVLSLAPDDRSICDKLAETYAKLGLMSEAIQQYRHLCNLCESQGLWEDCVKAAEQLVALDAANIAACIKLAEMQARAQHTQQAIEGFRRAAVVLLEAQRLEEWAKVLERIVQLDPTDAISCQTLAGYYLKHADAKRALGKLQIAFRLNAQDLTTLALLADVFEALQQPQKALSALRELAIQQRARHEHGGWDKTLRHILRLSPEDNEARELLGAAQTASAARPTPSVAAADVEVITAEPIEDDDSVLHSEVIDAEDIVEIDAAGGELGDDAVAKMLAEADTYIKYSLRDKAIEHLDQVLVAHPAHRGAQERYYKLLQAAGDAQKATARLLLMATQAHSAGHLELARRDLKELLASQPHHAAGRALLATLPSTDSMAPPPSASAELVDVDVDVEVDIDIVQPQMLVPAPAQSSDPAQFISAAEPASLRDAPGAQPEDFLVPAAQRAFEELCESGFGDLATKSSKAPGFEADKTAAASPISAPRIDVINLAFEPSQSAGVFDLDAGQQPAHPQQASTQAGDFTQPVTSQDSTSYSSQTSEPSMDLSYAPAQLPPSQAAANLELDLDKELTAPQSPGTSTAREVGQLPGEMTAELYEVRFFVKQGLFDEARQALAALSRAHPDNAEIRAYSAQIDQAHSAAAVSSAEPSSPPRPAATRLVDELADFNQSMLNSSDAEMNSAFENVFEKFTSDATSAPQLDADLADIATHFDLGIAYKEMGMLAEATAQFEHTTSFAQYEVNACTMLGLCHLELGRTQEALIAFRRGLGSPQITQQQATALRYEVALAYESMGQIVDALRFYEKTYEMDHNFRDVAVRLRSARSAASDSHEAPSPELDILLDDDAPPGSDDKVSFF